MGFRSGAWVKIWKIERGERSTKVRISISKKDKSSGEYVQDFNGYVTLAGTAHKQAVSLAEGDRACIGECDVSNKYDKEKKVTYTNFVIYSFKDSDNQAAQTPYNQQQPNTTPVSDQPDINEDDDGDLPF